MSSQPETETNLGAAEPGSRSAHRPRLGAGGIAGALLVLALIFGGLFALGFVPKIFNQQELKKVHEKTTGAVRVVHTVNTKAAPFEEQGILPGNIGAIQYATLYARVDGYLKKRFVDIGDHVTEGQLLALIDTPTIDEELNQARADLAEARSQLQASQAKLKEAMAQQVAAQAEVERAQADETYAQVTATRWKNMAARGAVSLQSRDEKERAYEAQSANVRAAIAQEKSAEAAVRSAESEVKVSEATVLAKTASVRRLEAEQSFKYVRAPFDGVITLRKVDPGALITAGSGSSQLELFQMAQIDTLRIYVNAPQSIAKYLEPGQKAGVLVPEFPGKVFPGRISNVSGALDPKTRTRQTEVRLENKDHSLLPGMYAQVQITAQRNTPWIKVPGTSLVPLADGMYVILVENGKAHYQKVEIGRDFGDEVEIQVGLKGGEQVIVSPPLELREGEPVNPEALDAGKS